MADTITRTISEWNKVSMKSEIIPKGVKCIEVINQDHHRLKVGDGVHPFSQLPYIGESEIETLAFNLYKEEHPKNTSESTTRYYVRLYSGWTDSKKQEYINRVLVAQAKELNEQTINPELDKMRDQISNIDKHNTAMWETLKEYEPLKEKNLVTSEELQQKLDELNIPEEVEVHEHDNQEILDQTTDSFTTELHDKIDELWNRKDDEISTDPSSHTHKNMNVLNNLTQTVIDQSHIHSNKDILDNTTASFTVAYKNQLDHLVVPTYDVFTGAQYLKDGTSGLVPQPKNGDQTKFLRGDGKWAVIDNIDAKTVNGHTVQKNVPSDAKFTDTTYTTSSPLSISNENNITIDLSGYATQTWVTNQINAIDLSDLDLTQYATKDYVDTAIATIEPSEPFDPTGYATEDYVDDAIDAIVFPTDATTVNHHTVLSDVPANAVFTDTIYTLPIASDQTLGGVMIGEGLEIANDGVLSVDSSIIPTVPNELGVMELVPKQNEAGILTKTKANNVVEDIDVLQYLNTITLNVGFTS